MVGHLIRKIHPNFAHCQTGVCAGCVPPVLEMVNDFAAMTMVTIESLVDY
jgi:hypothetical protein